MENEDSIYFKVEGAGEIKISKNSLSLTGRSYGFSFGVSWGRNGFVGGVLDREDAKKLADHIISEYNKITPEQKAEESKYLDERDERLKNYIKK